MSRPRVLVVRLGALGDVALALPALRLLRRSLPDAGLAWLIERPHAPLLEGNPDLNARFVADSGRWRQHPWARSTRVELLRLLRELRAERFDLALDLQGLWKSALWARWSGARLVLGLPRARRRERMSGVLLGAAAPEPTGTLHVSDLYLEAARAAVRRLGAEPVEGPDPESEGELIVLTPEERAAAATTLQRLALDRFVVINPGAAWETKRWPPERLGALARELAARHRLGVLVVHGPGEQALAEAVGRAAQPFVPVILPCSVRELCALSARARLFFSGDSGPYHIARSLGVSTVGLFGPTDPARNGPRGGRDRVVWGRVPCSPCYRRDCPTAIECMASVALPDVLAAAAELLEKRVDGPPPVGDRVPLPAAGE